MAKNVLKYLVKSSDSYPCFVWPVIEGDGGLLLVLSNDKQTVTSFRKIESLDEFDIVIPVRDSDVVINEGTETVFAYAFNADRYFYATLDEFSRRINGFLKTEPEAAGNDVFKRYALCSKIGADAQIDKLLVDIKENETDTFLIQWAKAKFAERERKPVDLSVPEKYENAKDLRPTVKQLKASLASSGIPVLEDLAAAIGDSPPLKNDDVLGKEQNLQGGCVNVLTADLQKTELVEDVLNTMAENMIDTTYKICSAQASSNYSEVIYEIKARLLEKNIEIDTKEKLEFFDVSKVPHAKDLQELLKNIVFWECAKGDNKESYLLIVEEDDWENSSSMESLGDKIHYLPIPATKAARIFNDLLTHGEKIAA